MNKIRITKQFRFEMAHALEGYDGACKHIHGHSYELFVTIIGFPIEKNDSPKKGMVMDFGDLKKVVHEQIIEPLDHALVLNKNTGLDKHLLSHEMFTKIVYVDYQPTSELMLLDFVKRIQGKLPENVKLHSMLFRETASSYAEWYAEDN